MPESDKTRFSPTWKNKSLCLTHRHMQSDTINPGCHITENQAAGRCHSAEKRNPENILTAHRPGGIHWIPLFSGMTACHRVPESDKTRFSPTWKNKSLCLTHRHMQSDTINPGVHTIESQAAGRRHSAEKRNPENILTAHRTGGIHWIPLFSGMTA